MPVRCGTSCWVGYLNMGRRSSITMMATLGRSGLGGSAAVPKQSHCKITTAMSVRADCFFFNFDFHRLALIAVKQITSACKYCIHRCSRCSHGRLQLTASLPLCMTTGCHLLRFLLSIYIYFLLHRHERSRNQTIAYAIDVNTLVCLVSIITSVRTIYLSLDEMNE